MYLRNLTYPRMMLGTPANSTVSMIADNQKGVTITAQEGRQDCFTQMWFNTPRDTSLVFQTDIWNVVGDQSTVRNGYVLIAELDPWNSLCSAASAGRTSLKFTPTRDFIIRLACPDSGSANFTQPLLMTEAEWNELHALGEGYFDGDLMPLTNGGGEAGLNAIVWLLASAAVTGWWPHELHHQPVHRPLMPQAVKHVGQQRRRECRVPRRRALPLHAYRRRLVDTRLVCLDGPDEDGPCRGRRLHGHQRAERGRGERHGTRLRHDLLRRRMEGGEDRRGRPPQHLLPWQWQFDVGGLGRVRGRRMADRPTTPPPVPVVRRRLDAPAVIGGERR